LPRKPDHRIEAARKAETEQETIGILDTFALIDPAAIGILLIAAFVHGAFGFGFPLVATPLLVLIMDMRAAVLLTLIPTIAINLVSIATERRWLEALRRFWPIPVFTMVGSLIGTRVLLTIDPEPVRLLLALVLIVFLILDRQRGDGPERRFPQWGLALLGLGMGLLAGLVNVFSPVVVAFALYTRMHPGLMVATFNLSFITSKTGQLAGFAAHDALEPAIIKLAALALPLVMVVLWSGIKVRRRLDQGSYRRWLTRALWVIATMLIVDSIQTASAAGVDGWPQPGRTSADPVQVSEHPENR
jgi:uncharacterized protein